MKIREAAAADVSAMVHVLNSSMGENDLSSSENIWHFKHTNNPFGKSLILVAEEKGIIVGIRAFMHWQWQNGEQIYQAYRAVDTATLPTHQGKGIFKRLTLQAVEIAKQQGGNFIFNTPNEKSRPGYLKMGWESVGKLNIGVKPALNSFWKWHKNATDYKITIEATKEELKDLCQNWNHKCSSSSELFTPKSPEYLKWRFEENPLQRYEVLATSDLYLAVYVKKRGKVKELRIAECLYRDNGVIKNIQRVIARLSSKFGVQVVTYSPQVWNFRSISIKGNFGPVFTLRTLNLELREKENFLQVENWNYSLGDLELF